MFHARHGNYLLIYFCDNFSLFILHFCGRNTNVQYGGVLCVTSVRFSY